mmetsp:Transcript_8080/g.20588  ORF Transcript_8080/g.20588 Transcript_8080/m.20588 type:complete len:201 (-) Transcript_8080:75-677(-)
MTFKDVIVVDCRAHLIGRLASVVAKELLLGQRVVLVRAEQVEISGPIWRNQIKMSVRRNKKMNSNPERGPFSIRAPAEILKRMIRGMVPHKTARGEAALCRLKVYEGIPHPYDVMKRVVIPSALRVLCLRPGRKFTVLGELAGKNGWKHEELLKVLEEKRKVKSDAYYQKRQEHRALVKQAIDEVELPAEVKEILAQYGH